MCRAYIDTRHSICMIHLYRFVHVVSGIHNITVVGNTAEIRPGFHCAECLTLTRYEVIDKYPNKFRLIHIYIVTKSVYLDISFVFVIMFY